MRNNMKRMTLGTALLLLAAACTQGENEPGAQPEGKIALTPTVALSTGWNTGADTRADQKVPAALAAGGTLGLGIAKIGANGDADMTTLRINFYEVTADGKLNRLPYSGGAGETEEPLNVDVPGEYFVMSSGEINLTTDGLVYHSYIANNVASNPNGAKITIGGDGKLSVPTNIICGGLRVNVKGTDGTAYAGADVTATLETVRQYANPLFDTKTLTAAAPSAIWGTIDPNSSVTAGEQLLGLTVGGKTYRVNAPRQISFTAGRLYTFNVRIGATSITVSSDDLAIGDFEVQASTSAEAEHP